MSLGIAGMGWVTPLGSELHGVWERLLKGDKGTVGLISSPLGADYPIISVTVENVPLHPRLRRSSSISRFAVVAGLSALEDAQLKLNAGNMTRMGLIFAVSNGGVIYTKRFYDQIVDAGAHAVSPLLFPETVFNAAASHVAAMLGISGASYTLVGDGAVGVLALKMAEDLMENRSLDYCLVIGAEETDWLLSDAYRKWRLLGSSRGIEPFAESPRGTILSEGAGAVLLSREGSIQIEAITAGKNFRKQRDAAKRLDGVFAQLCDEPVDLVVASANGTFIDDAERSAVQRRCPNARIYAMKRALGESVGASSLWQTIAGALSLRTHCVPPDVFRINAPMGQGSDKGEDDELRSALVSVCGMNQQVGGLRLVMK